MEQKNIESQAQKIATKLDTSKQNSKIRRLVHNIKENIRKSGQTNPSKERKKKTLTHHELSNVDFGLDTPRQEKSYVVIETNLIKELDTELKSIKGDLSNLSESIESFDIDEMSPTATRAKEEIFSIKDDFEYILFKRSEPIYNQYISSFNANNIRVGEENLNEFIEALDKVVEECKRAAKLLYQFEMPNEDTVQEEVQKTRNKRMKREWEEMKPFMAQRKIKQHFKQGEQFTAEQLASKIETWDKDTAQSVIEDAVNSDYDLDIERKDNAYILQ
jgi:hypothetical protein